MNKDNNATVTTAVKQINIDDSVCVTDKTARYLKLVAEVDVLWNKIYDQIEEDYGSSNVDNSFDKYFYNHLCGLKDSLFDYVTNSIREAISTNGDKIII